jgi:hypothetical protein
MGHFVVIMIMLLKAEQSGVINDRQKVPISSLHVVGMKAASFSSCPVTRSNLMLAGER